MRKGVFYINGMGTGESRGYENSMFRNLHAKDIAATHAHANWQSSETFSQMLDRLTEQALDMARDLGELCMVGTSAGGMMAVNIFKALRAEEVDVSAISIAGRLRRGNVHPWSYRTLERSSHLGTSRASMSFYDGLLTCEQEVLPSLTDEDNLRITVLQPLVDEVVPRHTMVIPRANLVTLPAIGHEMACRLGTSAVAKNLEP